MLVLAPIVSITEKKSVATIIKESYIQNIWLQCITIPIAALAAYHWFTDPWLLLPLITTVGFAYYAFTLIMKYYQLNHYLNDLVAQRTNALEEALTELRAVQAEGARDVILAVHDMAEELSLMHEQVERLSIQGPLRSSLGRLEHLVEDTLLASALKEHWFRLHPQAVNIQRLLAVVMHDLLRSDVAILLLVETENSWAWIEARRIKRVLRNIINNALQHGASQIEICLRDADGLLEIAICDNGQGMDAAQLVSIRERWNSGKIPRGYGLGLQAAARLVAQSSGRITLDSEGIGKGVTVRLAFPRPAVAMTAEVYVG